jgi:hypothetical protein
VNFVQSTKYFQILHLKKVKTMKTEAYPTITGVELEPPKPPPFVPRRNVYPSRDEHLL